VFWLSALKPLPYEHRAVTVRDDIQRKIGVSVGE